MFKAQSGSLLFKIACIGYCLFFFDNIYGQSTNVDTLEFYSVECKQSRFESFYFINDSVLVYAPISADGYISFSDTFLINRESGILKKRNQGFWYKVISVNDDFENGKGKLSTSKHYYNSFTPDDTVALSAGNSADRLRLTESIVTYVPAFYDGKNDIYYYYVMQANSESHIKACIANLQYALIGFDPRAGIVAYGNSYGTCRYYVITKASYAKLVNR